MNLFVSQLTYKRAVALMLLLTLALVCRVTHAEGWTLVGATPLPGAHLHVSKPASTPLNWLWLGPVTHLTAAHDDTLLGPIFEYIDDPIQPPAILEDDIELAKN